MKIKDLKEILMLRMFLSKRTRKTKKEKEEDSNPTPNENTPKNTVTTITFYEVNIC